MSSCCRIYPQNDLQRHEREQVLASDQFWFTEICNFEENTTHLIALSLYYSQTETSCKGSLSKCSVLKRPPTGKALAFIGLFNNNTRYCLPISCRCFQFLSYFKYS